MSNCTCGRTTRPPLCDNSHALSEEAYKERTERLNKFKQKIIPNWIQTIANSLPEHSEKMGQDLVKLFANLPSSIRPIDAHACSLVAAIVSGNGELGFEIGMNGILMGTVEREAAKAAASLIHQFIISDTATHCVFNIFGKVDRSSRVKGTDLLPILTANTHGVSPDTFLLYLFAGAVVLRDDVYLTSLNSIIPMSIEDKINIINISSIVATIGKVSL